MQPAKRSYVPARTNTRFTRAKYVNLRFDAIGERPGFKFGEKSVFVNNIRLTHRIWHDTEAKWLEELRHPTRATGDEAFLKGDVQVWAYGPFFSSERETKCTQGRAERFGDLARPVLVGEKGWLEADWRNVSMALSFETATALDGMHVIGPSMKVLFHIIMHEICGAV